MVSTKEVYMEKTTLTVALSGASGNMGAEVLNALAQSDKIEKVKILLLNARKDRRFGRAALRAHPQKIETVYGDIAEIETARKLVRGTDYVINCAAVIPPLADRRPDLADRCNRLGAIAIADAVAELAERQPKLVHISTVALYGHRNYLHPWGRVGDPLLPSVYDYYAVSKLKGERYVLESEVKNFVVLRQTGILHKNMLKNNMHDGLMFHTAFNVPLEWVTAEDCGLMIRHLVEYDAEGKLEGFWNRVYNIGGGAENRCTGYDTFEKGFQLIGGSTERFLKPGWNSIRNFHGLWFSDGDELNDRLHYITQNIEDAWRGVLKAHPLYRLARVLPPRLIGKLFIERLLSDENSPKHWIETGDTAKIKAFFGSRENLHNMPERWEDYPVLAKGELPDATVDYEEMKDSANVVRLGFLLNHGYDESKPDSELDLDDVRVAAAFRGGKCLSETMTKGDLVTKLVFECHDEHRFEARPYTVLKSGYWCPECCEPAPWNFDRLAKKIPFFAQVWYDTHAVNESFCYGGAQPERELEKRNQNADFRKAFGAEENNRAEKPRMQNSNPKKFGRSDAECNVPLFKRAKKS